MHRSLHIFVLISSSLSGLCLVGCQGLGLQANGSNLLNTSSALAAEPFEAPNDPEMGQIVLSVPSVSVSAHVPFGDLGQTVRTQFVNTLALSPNFIVADREALSEIAAEQKLAASGALDPRDQPEIGKLAGARYLIKVDVTEFQENIVGQAKGGQFKPGGFLRAIGGIVGGTAGQVLGGIGAADPTIGKANQTVHGIVGMEIRITDVDSGSVVAATRAHGSLTRENSQSIFGIAGISTTDSKFSQSVLQQATRVAIEDAVAQIHSALRDRIAKERSAELAKVGAKTDSLMVMGK